MEEEPDRLKAMQEAYRILKPHGIALFSFLSYEVRFQSWMYLPFILYLRIFRKANGSNRTIQSLPWLRLGGKVNYKAFIDGGPYVYWFKLDEACQLLTRIGFEIVAVGSARQIKQGRMYKSWEELLGEKVEGMLHVVCTK
jgi:SAM-dependent methyltransferase